MLSICMSEQNNYLICYGLIHCHSVVSYKKGLITFMVDVCLSVSSSMSHTNIGAALAI